MKKKVLIFFATIVLGGPVTYLSANPDIIMEDTENDVVISCDAKPKNKAKCWSRDWDGLGCRWTGNQSDWC